MPAAAKPPEDPNKRLDPVDRNKAWRSMNAELGVERKKVEVALRAAFIARHNLHAGVEAEHINVLAERTAVAEHFLGQRLEIDENSSQQPAAWALRRHRSSFSFWQWCSNLSAF